MLLMSELINDTVLQLFSSSLSAAVVITLFHNGYNNFVGWLPLEKLYGYFTGTLVLKVKNSMLARLWPVL